MTPSDVSELIKLIGLPATMFGVGMWLFITRRVCTRGEMTDMKAIYEKQIADRDARYAKLEAVSDSANEELRKQSSTNAALVTQLVAAMGKEERAR